ncbi:MAG: arylsulfatase [Bacteroidota bacterium]
MKRNINRLIGILLLFWGVVLPFFGQSASKVGPPPNVILVLTDDQGIGDLACHGNPWLKTPALDAFYEESVRLTNFHVSPLCTPTRGAIMTGKYPINNGAWATYKGRDALTAGDLTLAELFQQSGYATGLFGKWHLGDNYPVRATDCGFEVAIQHMAGGVGELSDYWGNTYFDDTYFVNNVPRKFSGYCTDVWFEEAKTFIEDVGDRPFFIYLPTNAPHSPLIAPESYIAPYRELEGKQIPNAPFYGMLASIDENFGKLDAYLKATGLDANTIIIFMSDNGGQFGYDEDRKLGFNKGFNGNKGDKLEGGHRVPFFIRWPEGGIGGGQDIPHLLAHIDLLPTLAGLCGLDIPKPNTLDGIDFTCLFSSKDSCSDLLSDRTLFIHHRQDWRPPQDVIGTCIMKDAWRLINGEELYDIDADPLQKKNIADQFPEVVEELLEENRQFLVGVKQNARFHELPVHVVGNPAQNKIKLTIQHAIGEDKGIWKPEQVAAGLTNTNNTHAIAVERPGIYRISCMRWPEECPGPIRGIPTENPKNQYQYQAISPNKVRLQIANLILEKPIPENADAVRWELKLESGKTLLVNDFIEGDQSYGVYYTYIEFLGDG